MTIEMINKNKFRVANDKKLLRKVGKQWVTVSALTLMLLGGGALVSSIVTHADTNSPVVEAQDTNNVKKQINSNLDKAYQATQSASGSSASSSNSDSNGTKATQPNATPQGIMKTASLLHANMLNNAQKPDTTPNSTSAKSSVASQSASSASSKASSSNDAMNTLNLGTKSEQARGWNFVQNGVRNNDFDNTKPSATSSSSSATQSASSSASASSVAPSNSVSASAKPSFNSAYQSYMAQMSGTDSEVASANAIKAGRDSNNAKVDGPLLKVNDTDTTPTDEPSSTNWIYDNGKYISSMPSTDDISDGTYNGLTYKYDKTLQALEFTGGKYTLNYTNDFINIGRFGSPIIHGGIHSVFQNYSLQSVKIDDNTDFSNVSSTNSMFFNDTNLHSLILPNTFNTNKVTDMGFMFYGDSSLQTLSLPASFNMNNVQNTNGMFANDNWLQKLIINSPNTKFGDNVLDKSYDGHNLGEFNWGHFDDYFRRQPRGIFRKGRSLQKILDHLEMFEIYYFARYGRIKFSIIPVPSSLETVTIPQGTLLHPYAPVTQGKPAPLYMTVHTDKLAVVQEKDGTYTVYGEFHIGSRDCWVPYLKYSNKLTMYKQNADNPYTATTPNDFTQGNVGTFERREDPEPVTDNVIFYTKRQDNDSQPAYNVRVGSDKVRGLPNTIVNVSDIFNDANMNGYTLDPNAPQTITLKNGAMNKVQIDNQQQANNSDDVPVDGNTVTFTGNIVLNFPERGSNHQIKVPYSINTTVDSKLKDILDDGIENGNPSVTVPNDYVGKTIQQFNTQNFTYQNANSSQANTYDNVYVQPADGTSDAPNVSDNGDGIYTYNNPDITFNFTANTVPETIHYQYNGKDISNNPKDANGNQETNDKNTTTVSGANDTQGSLASNNVPAGWHIATGANGEPNGNNSWIYGNEDADKPQGSHNVNVMPNKVNTIIQYKVSNGHVLNIVRKTGNDYRAIDAGNNYFDVTSSNDINMPKGYQLVNTVNKVPYDNGTHAIAVEPLPSFFNVIEYIDNNGQGSDVGDTSAYGQEGTDVPDKVIEDDVPKDYQLSPSQTLPVQFTKDNVIKVAVQNNDNKNSDMVVGTAFLTLLYQKGSHTDGQVLRLHINENIGDSDIVINPQDYDRDGYSVASSDNDWPISFKYSDVTKFTHDFSRYNREHTFTYEAKPVDIDIKYVDTQTGKPVTNSVNNQNVTAYDGDTANLQGTNSDNNVLSVDGKEYNLNLPAGYHLAHANNYIKVTDNGTYVKPVTTVGGTRMLRMPLMKLTLGITPHFRKPTSNSSITPVKPSSASSVTPQSASSASAEPSSASTVPSSASQSQSVTPSTSTASNTIAPNSTASVAPVTSNVAPSSIAPASISTKPSSISTNKAIARSVIRHTNHKKMAKHDTQQLNHQVTQGKHKLNTVERHIEARKATETKMVHKLVHAKKTIKRSQHKLTYLRLNKRHVKHALRRITRNKVAIKRAKRVVRTAKQARPKFVHAKVATVEPTTDESAATSVKVPVITPKVHAKSTATVHMNCKKLPQTGEATDHAGIVAIVLMVMSVILAGFDKVFSRKHNE